MSISSIQTDLALAIDRSGRQIHTPSRDTIAKLIHRESVVLGSKHIVLEQAIIDAWQDDIDRGRLVSYITSKIFMDGFGNMALMAKAAGVPNTAVDAMRTALAFE